MTGCPLHNALVWQDTRTQDIISALDADAVALLRARTGLRAATYFSGSKMKVTPACHPLLLSSALLPISSSNASYPVALATTPSRPRTTRGPSEAGHHRLVAAVESDWRRGKHSQH